ncbi:UNVERIFIED_ORG: hypothetical protein J2Y81_002140 [Paraburkholderia sediminicola]|jgi:hypothetical protein|uniref:hypothetical protein n=1 Tax=Paraburkholderia aspalathi TaxID=1324617 RepID=UPI0021134998|nr:hypothetical protein [Paraburkholderia sediminicola]
MNSRKVLSALLLSALIPLAYANNSSVTISPIPSLRVRSAPLEKSLRALRANLVKDAKKCTDNASGMDASAHYDASIQKTIETSTIAGFAVSGNSQCDGAHPNAYQYGILFDIADGKRFDLNEVYALGHRDGGSLFLTEDAAATVMTVFRQINSKRPECLDPSTFNEDYLTSKAFTMAVRPDGSLQLFFDTPYVEAACFSPIRLNAQQVSQFRNAQKASANSLP